MILRVEDLLQKELIDEVVVFQTDTVYGIGCLLNSSKGVEKIYEIKKRESKKPLAVLCSNLDQVKTLVKNFDVGKDLAEKHWPGALTLIFKKEDIVKEFVTSGFDTVGIRIPNDKVAISILERFGPMAVTSLNISSEPAILKYAEACKFVDKVDYVVQGKNLSNLSSTVYDCTNSKILRQGDISL